MRKDGKTHSPDEPARQKGYRKLYWRHKYDMERVDDVLESLNQRVRKLEGEIRDLIREVHARSGNGDGTSDGLGGTASDKNGEQ